MKITDEKLADFQSRLNHWISQQGLLFQLTNGGGGLGARSAISDILVRLGVSLVVLAILAALAFGGYLLYYSQSKSFSEGLETAMGESFQAEEIRAAGFRRRTNSSEFRNLYMKGGDESFFAGLEARSVQIPMSLTDGILGDWEAKRIKIESAFFHLKAGATTDSNAEKIWETLFQERAGFAFRVIEVRSANLSWGYSSPSTWGSIMDSQLLITKKNQGLEIEFKGGRFSQGIFKGFEIKSIRAVAKASGELTIHEAMMTRGKGTLSWTGEMVKGGASPVFECEGSFDAIPMSALLPSPLADKVMGSLAGTFTAKGSPNLSSGIVFEVMAEASQSSPLIFSNKVPILQIAEALDSENDYRRLAFNEGSLTIQTDRDQVQLSAIDLASRQASDGEVKSRLTGELTIAHASLQDLSQESVAFNDLYEEFLEANTEEKGAIEQRFRDEVRVRYGNFKNTNEQVYYAIKTESDSGEELKQQRLEPYPREINHAPLKARGQLQLAIPYRTLALQSELPALQIPEEGDLATIRFEVDGFATMISERLANRWRDVLRSQSRPSR